MTPLVIQWVVLVLCAVGAVIRVPGALKGHGRTVFMALVLLTIAVGLSIAPIYQAVDAIIGGSNAANLVLRLVLYAVFMLLGMRVAAALGSSLAHRLITGPVGLVILGMTVAATLYLFLISDLPFSSAGLRDFGDQDAVQHYAAVGRLYPGYVAACLVIPAVRSVFDLRSRSLHRLACVFLAAGFSIVVVFVALRILPLDLQQWDIILPFSAILLTVVGLCLIWLSHVLSRRNRAPSNKLA
jgi:hypothetical protein